MWEAFLSLTAWAKSWRGKRPRSGKLKARQNQSLHLYHPHTLGTASAWEPQQRAGLYTPASHMPESRGRAIYLLLAPPCWKEEKGGERGLKTGRRRRCSATNGRLTARCYSQLPLLCAHRNIYLINGLEPDKPRVYFGKDRKPISTGVSGGVSPVQWKWPSPQWRQGGREQLLILTELTGLSPARTMSPQPAATASTRPALACTQLKQARGGGGLTLIP